MAVNTEGRNQQTTAPAHRRHQTRLTRTRTLKPAAPHCCRAAEQHKKQVQELYRLYIEWLQQNNAQPQTVHAVQGVVDYMLSADHTDLIPEFKKETDKIDNIRDENLLEVFPELKQLW